MAEQSGLPDISKANFYGQSPDAQQELIDANETSIKALQQRYENPNWFNVAAGFFKPQLGGFAASLGSASQALGENLEKQRANELTVAQYRAQVALMKNQLGQNQKANELLAAAKGVITPDLVREMEARVGKDHPTVLAAKDTLATQQKTQEIAQGAQTLALQRLKTAIESNLTPTAQMYKDAGYEPPAAAGPPAAGGGNPPAPIEGSPAAPESVPAQGVPTSAFINATHKIENPANLPKGTGPGTAPQQGPGQFTDATLKTIAEKYPNVGNPADYGKPGKEDTTHAFDTALLGDHHASLVAAGVKNPTALDHRLAWHFGAEGANKLKSVDENTPLGAVMTTKDANGAEVPNTDLLAKNKLKPSMTVKELKQLEGSRLYANGVNPDVPVAWGTEAAGATGAAPAPTSSKTFPYAYKPLGATDLQMLSAPLQSQKMQANLENAKSQEDISTSNLAPLAPYAGPIGTQILNQSKAIEKAIASNPKAAEKVYNVLGQGTVMAQILKTAEAGLQFNGGILSGSLSIPTSVWENAKLPPELWSYANDLVTHSLILQSAKARAAGQNITKIPVAEYLGQQNATANLHQPWDSALHSVRNDILDAWHQRNIYHTVVSEKQKVASGELAPTTAVMQHSPAYKKAMADWEQEVADLNSEREKGRKFPK